MKLKLLIWLLLCSTGVSAQSWINFGTGQTQRKISGVDTIYRTVGSSVGTYIYWRSDWYNKQQFPLDANVLHKTGDETATGTKTLQNIILNNSTVSTPVIDFVRTLNGGTIARAIKDQTVVNSTHGLGYNSIDVEPMVTSTGAVDHINGFQSRPMINSSGITLNTLAGYDAAFDMVLGSVTDATSFKSRPQIRSSATNLRGFEAFDYTESGTVTSNIAFYARQLTKGTNNFAFYSEGNTPNFFGGQQQLGDKITFMGAGIKSIGWGGNTSAGAAFPLIYSDGSYFVLNSKSGSPLYLNFDNASTSSPVDMFAGKHTFNFNGNATTTGTYTMAGLNLSSTPTTSAVGYDLLTRNTSTGAVEKVASSTFATSATTIQNQTLSPQTASFNINGSGLANNFEANNFTAYVGTKTGEFSTAMGNAASTFTVTSGAHSYFVNSTSGTVTVNLPDATTFSNTGRILVIKKVDASGNSVVIDGFGTQTIDGATTQTITTQYDSITIQSNGANWFII